MHAVYCFLCTGDDPAATFVGSSFCDKLDENNWYQEMCAVNPIGQVTELCPAEDYRERDSLGKKFLAKPPESRWQAAVEFAESCVLWDINLALSDLDAESQAVTRLEDAEAVLRQKLAANALAGHPWEISQAAQILEQLDERVGPFTRCSRDAYNTIRALALDGEVTLEDPQATILFVDIHT